MAPKTVGIHSHMLTYQITVISSVSLNTFNQQRI